MFYITDVSSGEIPAVEDMKIAKYIFAPGQDGQGRGGWGVLVPGIQSTASESAIFEEIQAYMKRDNNILDVCLRTYH